MTSAGHSRVIHESVRVQSFNLGANLRVEAIDFAERQYMRRKLGRILTVTTILAGVAVPAAAQGTTPLFRMICTAENYPLCGWGGVFPENQYHRRQLVLGAGPAGQNVVQFDLIPSSSQNQFYLGWSTQTGSVPRGGVRYVRVRVKILIPYNPLTSWTDKWIIVGDGSNDDTSRVIIELGPHTSPELQTAASRNIDGYPGRTQPYVTLNAGVWHHLQYELRSATTASSADGRMKVWQNAANSNYSSPSAQSGAIQLNTTNWGSVGLGLFANETLPIGGQLAFQVTDFEYDDEFDPNWFQMGPSPPTNPRILREASLASLGSASLGLILLVRRRSDR